MFFFSLKQKIKSILKVSIGPNVFMTQYVYDIESCEQK